MLLLLPPYLISHGQPPLALVVGWTALLGVLTLGGLGIVVGIAAADVIERTSIASRPESQTARRAPIVAALIASIGTISAWQMIGFALSGMETVLFALGALLLLVLASRGLHPVGLGLVAAALIYTRPEGCIPAALVFVGSGWAAVSSARERPSAPTYTRLPVSPAISRMLGALRGFVPYLARWLLRWALPFGATLLLALVPYLMLNLAASGHPLPTTVYAKAAVSGIGSAWAARLSVILLYVGILLVPSPFLLALAAQCGILRILRRNRFRRPAGPAGSATASGGGRQLRRGSEAS